MKQTGFLMTGKNIHSPEHLSGTIWQDLYRCKKKEIRWLSGKYS